MFGEIKETRNECKTIRHCFNTTVVGYLMMLISNNPKN
jgi:hypothetical protein